MSQGHHRGPSSPYDTGPSSPRVTGPSSPHVTGPSQRCLSNSAEDRVRPAAACHPHLLLLLQLPVSLICVSNHITVHCPALKCLSTPPHLRPNPLHRHISSQQEDRFIDPSSDHLKTGPNAKQPWKGRRTEHKHTERVRRLEDGTNDEPKQRRRAGRGRAPPPRQAGCPLPGSYLKHTRAHMAVEAPETRAWESVSLGLSSQPRTKRVQVSGERGPGTQPEPPTLSPRGVVGAAAPWDQALPSHCWDHGRDPPWDREWPRRHCLAPADGLASPPKV